MDKKKVCKLPPGTFVEILWADSKPTVGMLLEKPQRSNGDISLTVFHVDSKAVDSHAVHSQVSRVLGSGVSSTRKRRERPLHQGVAALW